MLPCLFLCALLSRAAAQSPGTIGTNSPNIANITNKNIDRIILPPSVPDPIEPINRGMWAFNVFLMSDIVRPTAKGYRFIVRKPVRNSLGNFERNITYPVRLVNNLLQGKWSGARHETDRFFCNTVVGAAGFVDVATKWKIPKSDADFGQTLGQWGWHPHFYLMLPVYGPSNDRDTVGLAGDTAANPFTYLPYFTDYPSSGAISYISPYTYWSYAAKYNDLSDTVDDYARFAQTEQDPYSEIQYAWTFVRKNRVADFRVTGQMDQSSLETLGSVFFVPQDPEFPNRGRTRTVTIPTTHKELDFTVWMQPGKAGIVYIIPGLGSHRLASTALALAELVYNQGYSVVTISSPYNYEFMRHASTALMPAYTPVDARDLHVALTAINRKLDGLFPGRIGDKALMGYSMGAFESLFIAGAPTSPELMHFDRYIGINTPVRLLYGVGKLDEFYNAPLVWPVAERTDKMENIFLKVAAVSQNSITPNTTMPFDGTESKFLVGLVFRLILRDAIYTSQDRHNQRVLAQPVTKWNRTLLYDEILQYSFHDYFEKFVTPYYRTRGIDLTSGDTLDKASNLRTYTDTFRTNSSIRLMVNRDDFLLPPEDLEWLQSIFPPEQLKIFEQGGHLGNLSHPPVQKTILEMLDGLGPVHPKPPPKASKSNSAAPANPTALPKGGL